MNGDTNDHRSCYFWDIRSGECRYEMLFLGCRMCESCPENRASSTDDKTRGG